MLCNSGEDEFQVETGDALQYVIDQAGRKLDGACLNNVVVVKTRGKFYVGDFAFEFHEVTEKEARRVAKDFNDNNQEEEE